MSDEKGELHTSDDFSKAKRYLLWSCSLAILLWMVHVENGSVDSPILGTSAKMGVDWLRGAIWLSCVYFLVGFFRQVRNVERVNSQMLYAKELANMRQRLRDVSWQFTSLGDAAQTIGMKLLTKHGWLPDATTVSAALGRIVDHQISNISTFGRRYGDPEDESSLKIPPTTLNNYGHIMKAESKDLLNSMFTEFGDRIGPESHPPEGEELVALVKEARKGATDLAQLGSSFYEFSEEIVSEHRTLFKWYDKYLGYAMFALATVASAWPPVEHILKNMQPVPPAEIPSLALQWGAALLLGVLLLMRMRRRDTEGGPEHYFRLGKWHFTWQRAPKRLRSAKRRRRLPHKKG